MSKPLSCSMGLITLQMWEKRRLLPPVTSVRHVAKSERFPKMQLFEQREVSVRSA